MNVGSKLRLPRGIPGFLALVAIGILPLAHAHTHLERSVPADHAQLAQAPTEVTLEFASPVILVSARLQSPSGGNTNLTVGEEQASRHKLALPALTDGAYRIEWRAQGHDGHAITGTIGFQVKGPATR